MSMAQYTPRRDFNAPIELCIIVAACIIVCFPSEPQLCVLQYDRPSRAAFYGKWLAQCVPQRKMHTAAAAAKEAEDATLIQRGRAALRPAPAAPTASWLLGPPLSIILPINYVRPKSRLCCMHGPNLVRCTDKLWMLRLCRGAVGRGGRRRAGRRRSHCLMRQRMRWGRCRRWTCRCWRTLPPRWALPCGASRLWATDEAIRASYAASSTPLPLRFRRPVFTRRTTCSLPRPCRRWPPTAAMPPSAARPPLVRATTASPPYRTTRPCAAPS